MFFFIFAHICLKLNTKWATYMACKENKFPCHDGLCKQGRWWCARRYLSHKHKQVAGRRVCLPKYFPTLVRVKPDLGISIEGPISHSRAWAVAKYTITHWREPSCESLVANKQTSLSPTNQLPFPHIRPLGGKRNYRLLFCTCLKVHPSTCWGKIYWMP